MRINKESCTFKSNIRQSSLLVLLLGLWPPIVVSTPITIKDQDRPSFSHNATLHRRENINTDGGGKEAYSKKNWEPKDTVKSGHHDILRMSDFVHPFLAVNADGEYIELDLVP